MSATVETLQLEIVGGSRTAEKGLDALISTLGRLRSATRGGAGLSSFVGQLETLNKATGELSSTGLANLRALSDGLEGIARLGNIKLSTSLASQIIRISEATRGLNGANLTPLSELAGALQPLSTLGKINLAPAVNQLDKLPPVMAALESADMQGFSSRVRELTEALKPLEGIGKSTLGSVVSALAKLPAAMRELAGMDMGAFADQVRRVTDALAPLADSMSKVSAGFALFPRRMRALTSAGGSGGVTAWFGRASASSGMFYVKLLAAAMAVKRLAGFVAGMVGKSTRYVEDLNLFTASMGDAAAGAQAFAERVGELMGIDPADWMRSQGIFQTLITGFGIAAKRALVMSQTLTQLGYDLSSFFNISVADAMQKLQSGMAGELEPLRRLGYDLSMARLEAVALELGITKAFNAMSQAEKSQLRYYAILTQVTLAQGDMSRTLEAPANQLRVFAAQVQMAGRAIGNIFVPALNAILPYAIAVVKVVRWVAQEIANLFGFSLPEIDYSGLSDITSGAGEAEDALGGAAGAAKKLKDAVLGFDELNVIDPTQNGGSGNGGSGGGGDFDFELPTYDFLGDLAGSKVTAIFESWKRTLEPILSWLIDNFNVVWDVVKSIGLALLTWKIVKPVADFVGSLLGKDLNTVKIATGITLMVTGYTMEFSGFREIGSGSANLWSYIKAGLGAALGIGGSLLLLGTGPAGWTVGIGLALVVAVSGLVQGNLDRIRREFEESFRGLSNPIDPDMGDFLLAMQEATSATKSAAAEINNLSAKAQNSRIMIERLTPEVNTYIGLLGKTGMVTQEEVDKILLKLDALYAAVDENLNASSTIIRTALFDALVQANADAAPEIQKLIGLFDSFVEKTQGRVGLLRQNIESGLSSLVNIDTASTEFEQTKAQIAGWMDELTMLTREVSEARYDYKTTLALFTEGKIDLGDDPAGFRKAATDVAQYAGSYVTELSTAHKNTLMEIDRWREMAVSQGDWDMVATMDQIKETIVQSYEANVQQVVGGVETMYTSAQAKLFEGLPAVIEQGRQAVEEALNGQDATDFDYMKGITEALYDWKTTTLKPALEQLAGSFSDLDEETRTQLESLGVNGSTWAIDAFNIIYDAFASGDFTSISPELLQSLTVAFEAVGLDITPVAQALGFDISDFVKTGFDENKGTLNLDPSEISTPINTGIEDASAQISPQAQALGQEIGPTLPKEIAGNIPTESPELVTAISTLVTGNLAATAVSDLFMGEGANAVSGYKTGIEDNQQTAFDAVTAFSDGAVLALADAQGSHSPATAYIEQALFAMQGYAQGVTDNTPLVTVALTAMLAAANTTILTATPGIVNSFGSMFSQMLSKVQTFVDSGVKALNRFLDAYRDAVNSAANMPSIKVSTSGGSLPGYASGGFPESGQMFIAREAGAEMVGSIGRRTAVANNDQIVESVSRGVYDAVTAAMGATGGSGGDMEVKVYLDGRQISASVEKRQRERGRRILAGGVS